MSQSSSRCAFLSGICDAGLTSLPVTASPAGGRIVHAPQYAPDVMANVIVVEIEGAVVVSEKSACAPNIWSSVNIEGV